jgi:hypothetical protein
MQALWRIAKIARLSPLRGRGIKVKRKRALWREEAQMKSKDLDERGWGMYFPVSFSGAAPNVIRLITARRAALRELERS